MFIFVFSFYPVNNIFKDVCDLELIKLKHAEAMTSSMISFKCN